MESRRKFYFSGSHSSSDASQSCSQQAVFGGDAPELGAVIPAGSSPLRAPVLVCPGLPGQGVPSSGPPVREIHSCL